MKNYSTRSAALAFALLAAAGLPHAAAAEPGNLTIAGPWSRPTPPAAATGVVYLSITNRGAAADRLIALTTPIARSAEIHESRAVDGMVGMRQLAALACPAHATVTFEPGGLHVMLVGLVRPLTAGADFPLTLRFQAAGEITVQVHVGERE